MQFQEVDKVIARTSGPVLRHPLHELLSSQSMDVDGRILDLVRRQVVLVERLDGLSLLEEDGRYLDRLVISKAGRFCI